VRCLRIGVEPPPGGLATGYNRPGLRQGFRIHLTVYVLVNLLLIGIWAASGGGYFWPIWPILGWGMGIAAHAAPIIAGVGRRPRHRRPRPQPRSPDRPRPRSRSRSKHTAVDDVASAVGAERPSLRPAAAPDGTVTMLFTDIEGSTVLNERLGDLRWLELLRLHNAIIREQVAEHAGYEVKSQGDGFMIAFPSARRAVQCARAIQREIDAQVGDHPDGPIRLRIGLHTGEAIREEADFYGKNVVVAARIADQAQGHEILASSVVKQLTESAGDVVFEDARQVKLAGLAGTHPVYKVV
jgi:class 3 adenylate cyclase